MLDTIKKKRAEGGFTLIELLIVIVILAILAAIVVFAVGTTSANAVIAACRADAKSVETATEAYHAQLGTFPPSVNALTAAVGTAGPWLRAVPNNGTHYTISESGNGSITVSGPGGSGDLDTGGGGNGAICDTVAK